MFRTLEFRRQIFHILFGIILILLLKANILTSEILFFIIIAGIVVIFFCKKNYRIPLIHSFLHFFEREKHLRNFPGRGIFFYLLGSFLVINFFSKEIAIASIAILAFGDATTNFIGHNFGKIRITFKPKKSIEGTIAGIIAGFLGAYMFCPDLHPLTLLVASIVAIFSEIPNISFFKFPIDDNLIIPLVSGLTLTLIYNNLL